MNRKKWFKRQMEQRPAHLNKKQWNILLRSLLRKPKKGDDAEAVDIGHVEMQMAA